MTGNILWGDSVAEEVRDADEQDTRAYKQPPQRGWPPAASGCWRGYADPGGALVRLRGLALVPHSRRPRRGHSARPPPLRNTEGEDDYPPLLQGQPRRKNRLPLQFREGSSRRSRFIWKDLAPSGFGKAPQDGRGSTFSRAGARKCRSTLYAGHKDRRAGLGDRGGRGEYLILPRGCPHL